MPSLDDVLDRLEALVAEVSELDEPVRQRVFELLDGIDALHRLALTRLGEALDEAALADAREDPAVAWLLDAYAVGVDQQAAADAALESIRPYITSHGGAVEVLAVRDGVVRVRMSGACSGCTASAVTLQEGIEEALREGFPGFAGLDVEEDDAAPHPPPGPTLVQISRPT
ncbi:MAG: NifU family protein [Egibacteraceae bacterium]